MLPVETLKLIQATACQAEAAQVIAIDDPEQYHVRFGNQIMTIPRPAKPRKHLVDDLPSFIRAVEAFSECGASVWHRDAQIVALLCDSTRRDTVTMDLRLSDEFRHLTELDGKLLDQRSFCQVLKMKLGLDETFVGQFRRLDWRSEKQASGTAARGQDRMGISISEEVNGVADLADEVTLQIPVYELAGFPWRYKIPCWIEIDAPQQKLGLVAKPGAVQLAVDQAQHDIHVALDEGLNAGEFSSDEPDVPIFYGAPF